jgi:signal transduction histidine kinase
MFMLFAALVMLSAVGMASLIALVFRGSIDRVPGGAVPLFAVAALFVIALLILGVTRVGRPLMSIMEAANRIAAGDYSARVQVQGPPPVRMVGGAFNSMAGKLQAQDRLRRNLMADIAHELRTPLAVMQGRLEGLIDGVYPRDDAHLEQVLDETRTLARLVEDLRTLAHTESGMLDLQKEPTDLASLAADAAGALSGDAEKRRVAVRIDAPAELPLVTVDPLRIREVLVNLLSNALRHTPRDGRVTVTLRARGEHIAVAVADTGSGIPPEQVPRIFDRFYKGPESTGTGLGLTIARNLVAAHGGDIRAESTPGSGTVVTFTV